MSGLIDRFGMPAAQLAAMLGQRIINGNRAAAQALVDAGELVAFAPGQEIIAQGAWDSDAYFLLAGAVEIRINGKLLPYGRGAGEVIGEFSAINSALARTATINAVDNVVALKCTSDALRAAANSAIEVWELLAIDLTRKVEQRNRFINACNDRPVIFMIATEEHLEVAKALELALSSEFEIMLWSDEDLFPPGAYELDILNRNAAIADFAVVLAHPDDLKRSRDRHGGGERESILFELGFLMPVVGRHRTIILIPEEACGSDPAEFKGVRPWCYEVPNGNTPRDIVLAKTVRRLRNYITETKIRSRLQEQA